MTTRKAAYKAPDIDCYTLPNGECVSPKDCMHGPASEPDAERCGPHCEPAAIEQHCACGRCHG